MWSLYPVHCSSSPWPPAARTRPARPPPSHHAVSHRSPNQLSLRRYLGTVSLSNPVSPSPGHPLDSHGSRVKPRSGHTPPPLERLCCCSNSLPPRREVVRLPICTSLFR